jgi:hypothetical protein
MNQPNQRGGGNGYRQQQAPQSLPGTIKTKKYQFDPNTYTRIAMGEVWRKEWWYALIPFVVGVLPAAIWPSWWWLLLGVALAAIFVLIRSSLVTGVTQMEQSKPLFERMNYEADSRQLIMRQTEQKAMALPWDQIGRVRREPDAYLLYLKPGAPPAELAPWRRWVATTFDVPVFLHLPLRLFNNDNDRKLFEALLRRKGLLPTDAPAA